MRYYTQEQCEEWLRTRQRALPDILSENSIEHVPFPEKSYRLLFFSQWIARSIAYRQPVLLWITEWGIWPSSENWHLYYKLRQSYADQRLLHEAPGHLFLEHESEDLGSFLQVAMLNGWGGYVLTQADYVNVFFSHDEYVDFIAKLDGNLAEVRKQWLAQKTQG
jgi:hypothetical protein